MRIPVSKFDVWASGLFLLFGIYVLVQARDFGITSDMGPGSGTFPFVAGVFITVFSAANVLRAIRADRPKHDAEATLTEADDIRTPELAKVVAIIASIGVYLTLFHILGPFVHLPVLMVAISLIIHWRVDPKWLVALCGISVFFTVACYFIFAVFLRVLLPSGPFGF